MRQTAKVPPGWDAANRGAGIPDAQALLRLPLAEIVVEEPPDLAPDDAAQRFLDRAARLVEAPSQQVRDALAGLFADDEDRIARFGDELVFRVSDDEGLRASLTKPPGAALEDVSSPRARLEALASPSLREALA